MSGRPKKALGNEDFELLDGEDDEEEEEHRDQSTNISQYKENRELKLDRRIL